MILPVSWRDLQQKPSDPSKTEEAEEERSGHGRRNARGAPGGGAARGRGGERGGEEGEIRTASDGGVGKGTSLIKRFRWRNEEDRWKSDVRLNSERDPHNQI